MIDRKEEKNSIRFGLFIIVVVHRTFPGIKLLIHSKIIFFVRLCRNILLLFKTFSAG